MIFKRFTILTVLRIILIMITVFLFIRILGDDRLLFNQIILSFILIVQVWELIRYVNITNRELTRFFQSIKQADFTINFTKDTLGNSFSGLFDSMRNIVDAYETVKIEKEAQFHLLSQIISHVPTGIIVIAERDSIVLLNDAARNILDIPNVKSWIGLQAKAKKFTEITADLPSSGRFLTELETNNGIKTLSLDLSRFTLLEKEYELITFSDIKSEIEQKEIEAWHRLIRILTHEIMNSVTPISSLTETMQQLISQENKQAKSASELKDQTVNDLLFSLETIQKRSDGLLNFVEDFRRLTKVPQPDLQQVSVNSILNGVVQLMSADLKEGKINIEVRVNEDFTIPLDQNLVEQVLLNLIKNSIEATDSVDRPEIILNGYEESDKSFIEIVDNGPGIDPDDINDIWVPFYTTKRTGSGIGLSLSKQIMKLHRGNITVKSSPMQQTIFRLEFPKK